MNPQLGGCKVGSLTDCALSARHGAGRKARLKPTVNVTEGVLLMLSCLAENAQSVRFSDRRRPLGASDGHFEFVLAV